MQVIYTQNEEVVMNLKHTILSALGGTLIVFGIIIFVQGIGSGEGWLFAIIMVIVGIMCYHFARK